MTEVMAPSFLPTPEQRVAIEHPLAPVLIVAGAGTGKTTVMAERMLHLIMSGQAAPGEILGLTFTNKAAANLKRLVATRLGSDTDVSVATYHSFGAQLVGSHALELGLHPRSQILNRAQAWQLLYAVFDEFRFERRSTYVPRVIVDDALALASRCADHLVDIGDVAADCEVVAAEGAWARQREAAAKRLELCQVVAAYERRKRERHLLDYGDQINLAVALLRDHPEIAARLGQQHPVVLLDEYQDTNYAQRIMLQAIYPAGSAITAVGDDMQSIYAFRGAHLGNILAFTGHFPPATRLTLETNRRSGAALVELANRIQAQVTRAHPKTLRSLPGADPTVIECFVASDDVAEAKEVARDIAAIGPPWDSHAVLCRKRRLIPAIASALEDYGLPVDVVGAGGLLDRPEVVDVVAWLEILSDIDSSVALLRVLRGPRYGIGMRDLAAVARHARSLSTDESRATIADALGDLDAIADLSTEARGRIERFVAEWRGLEALTSRTSILDLAELVARRTGTWSDAGNRGRENLLRFFDLAARFAPVDGDPGLTAFVEYLRLMDEAEEELAEAHPTDLAAVKVMTIHQAKGLEFPNVWVPGLAGGGGRGPGIFPDSRLNENPLGAASALPWWLRPDDEGLPSWRDVAKEADLTNELRLRQADEELRLFYVACTRAQRRLVLSAAHWYAGPAEPQGPSDYYRFVADQADLVTERFHAEPATVDPAVAARERRRAIAASRSRPEATQPDLFTSAGIGVATPVKRPVPVSLSVSTLVDYARCPLQFYWSTVRPLPRRQSEAARVGTAVHRWIEERSGHAAALRGSESLPESGVAPLHDAYLGSPYAHRVPARVEAPFELPVARRLVRGRIDAVYDDDDIVELVDFKTGRPPAAGDSSEWVQLTIYAVAAVDTWDVAPDALRTTYCYLSTEGHREARRDWDASAINTARESLVRVVNAVADRHFDPTPGVWCRGCQYVHYCDAGQSFLRAQT